MASAIDPSDRVELDGRRRRSAASREKIVDAMIEITRSGNTSPSAEQVAVKAGVGRRTVFRLFKDMDSIYSEMTVTIRRRLATKLAKPARGETPGDTLEALIDRRVLVFEDTLPIWVAAAVHRPRSAFLQQQHREIAQEMRDVLAAHLPGEAVNDVTRLEALDLILSVEAWVRLRKDQKCNPEVAANVLKHAALATLNA